VETTVRVNYHLGDRSEGEGVRSSGSSSSGSSSSSDSSASSSERAEKAVKKVEKRTEKTGEKAEKNADKTAEKAEKDAEKAEQAEKAEKGQRVAGGVMAGQLLSHVDPVYPAEAKEKRIQGAVVLKAVISKEGTVENLQVVSGPEELASSAIDAVRQWTYKPYLLNGEPTEVETTITVNYRFGGGLSEVVPRRIGNGVSSPTVLHTEDPSYSEAARKEKISGDVLLNLVVDEQGKPTHVHVVRGLGHGLDEKAIEAVRQYKFKPGMENGQPVAVALNIQVNFQVF
jgi:TonB family protein